MLPLITIPPGVTQKLPERSAAHTSLNMVGQLTNCWDQEEVLRQANKNGYRPDNLPVPFSFNQLGNHAVTDVECRGIILVLALGG